MRKPVVYMVLLSMCCLMALWIQAAFAGPEGGVIVAPQTDASIRIDGNLNEWNPGFFTDAQKIVLTIDNGFINVGDIDDDDDFSVVVYAMYDEDNLYLAAEVKDDATDNAFVEANNWQNDCIEIWIDGAGDDGTMTDRGGNDQDNYQLNVDVNGEPFVYRNDDAGQLLAEIESASAMDGTNYVLEVQIPFSAIPELDLSVSRIMGFGVSFVDSDQTVWNHILWQGETENEPLEWGDLEFSTEFLAVKPTGKLSATWGSIKSNNL